MRLCSIASGSSGNCIYVGSDDTHVLIDTGISKKRIEEGLKELSIKPEELSGILITHEHTDHIQGLGVFSRKYEVPIYATKGSIEGILESRGIGLIPKDLFVEISDVSPFYLGDLEIQPFSIPHDAREPIAYRLNHGKKSFAVVTDLGTYSQELIETLKDLNGLLLEANHDVHMLEVGSYPYALKQRVLGEKGHLSNEASGRLLSEILHTNLKGVILGHLSKENNYEALAYETVKLEVTLGKSPFQGEEIPLVVAKRNQISPIIEV